MPFSLRMQRVPAFGGHRAAEFKKFLAKLDTEVPTDLDIHLILDNYATHKTPAIKKWRWHIPASTCTSRPPAHPG